MRILIGESQQSMAHAMGSLITSLGHSPTLTASKKSLDALPAESYDLIIVDTSLIMNRLSSFLRNHEGTPVIFVSTSNNINDIHEAIENGAVDFLLKPFKPEDLKHAINKSITAINETLQPTKKVDLIWPSELPSIQTSEQMKKLRRILKCVCESSVTVLVTGESGTGKEVVAKYIKENSTRKDKPFIAINCAAIPDNLLESDLFGYRKGAFTGAVGSNIGKFELAGDGIILLDEVSEMPLPLQAKFLRVLQEREFYPVGGTKLVPLKARIIATSNRDLKKCVEDGTFREDLYYRLNVIPVHIPPLRERPEDSLALAELFLTRALIERPGSDISLSEDAVQSIKEHAWPGNIRELENAMTRATLLCETDEITSENLSLDDMSMSSASENNFDSDIMNLHELEKLAIIRVLKFHDGNRTHAAESLGISIRTLRNKINEYQGEGIAVPSLSANDTAN